MKDHNANSWTLVCRSYARQSVENAGDPPSGEGSYGESRRMRLLKCAMLLVAASLAHHGTASAQDTGRPPNILIIMADDLGFADYEWLKGSPHYKVKSE
jgi:hypothetical protein